MADARGAATLGHPQRGGDLLVGCHVRTDDREWDTAHVVVVHGDLDHMVTVGGELEGDLRDEAGRERHARGVRLARGQLQRPFDDGQTGWPSASKTCTLNVRRCPASLAVYSN